MFRRLVSREAVTKLIDHMESDPIADGMNQVLPESAKPPAPSPGVSLSEGANGNANIELRNNGSGTPYIDFAQKFGVDYDARIVLTEPGKLAIKGATLSARSFETDAGVSLATLQKALNARADRHHHGLWRRHRQL